MMFTAIVWLRRDLRIEDHPALHHACQEHEHVLPIYLWQPTQVGQAQRWWVHHSLQHLTETYRQHGLNLALFSGDITDVVQKICSAYPIRDVYWNTIYQPDIMAQDDLLRHDFIKKGLGVHNFADGLLCPPCHSQRSYQVFTPFWKNALSALQVGKAWPAPQKTLASNTAMPGDLLESWQLIPTQPAWATEFGQYSNPGEEGAKKTLHQFFKKGISSYDQGRNQVDCRGTSTLSPHIHFGEISIHELWRQVASDKDATTPQGWDAFARQLGWREFSYHILYNTPSLPFKDLKTNLAHFPWNTNSSHWSSWTKGQTGIPLVDAGMRQLWRTGWMHNRVRMVVASFLTKNLRIHWTKGAQWFMDTLLDADIANNSAGWQWVAGCGADAAPFFRIFNPITQGLTWDPDASYIKQWIPELDHVSAESLHSWIHLEQGVSATYPRPIVSLQQTRVEALNFYRQCQ